MNLLQRLRRRVPSREEIQAKPWLRWLGPTLQHPRLWHLSRRGVALGAALGMFFGLLLPLAQIPASVGAAIVLRANVPIALASTLVTNPVTWGPVYFGAWRVGSWVLGDGPKSAEEQAEQTRELAALAAAKEQGGLRGRVEVAWLRLSGVGKPLAVGLAIFACVAAAVSYAAVSGVWHWRVRRKRRGRVAGR